jgi:hypothetical protein
MTNTQDTRDGFAAGSSPSRNDRSDIIEVLAEAGLGQGHGIEWLVDRLMPGVEAGR